jgi:hypothetical protein
MRECIEGSGPHFSTLHHDDDDDVKIDEEEEEEEAEKTVYTHVLANLKGEMILVWEKENFIH